MLRKFADSALFIYITIKHNFLFLNFCVFVIHSRCIEFSSKCFFRRLNILVWTHNVTKIFLNNQALSHFQQIKNYLRKLWSHFISANFRVTKKTFETTWLVTDYASWSLWKILPTFWIIRKCFEKYYVKHYSLRWTKGGKYHKIFF